MDHFNYVDGWLHAEDVPLTRIAEAVGTPAYVYSAATLTRHFKLFQQALAWTGHASFSFQRAIWARTCAGAVPP